MSRRKTERLLSLVLCLLAARRYLTAEQIHAAVPGYPPPGEAFKRMFERDKDELRELGIPLETGRASDDDTGYRISRHEYELPEITLETDEAAVLSLAARVWRRAELADAAAGGLLKLRAAGVEPEDIPGIEPRVRTDDAAFPAMWQAVRDRRPVTFSYQAVGRAVPEARHLEPWGVVSRFGRWYVGGFDRDREAARVFRLSRVKGLVSFDGPPRSFTVPDGTDVRDLVRSRGGQDPQQRTAVVRVRQGAGYGLRRWAMSTQPPELSHSSQQAGPSQPSHQLRSSQPSQQAGSSQPSHQLPSSQPSQQAGSSQPSHKVASSQPSRQTASYQSSQQAGASHRSQLAESSSQSSQLLGSSQPSQWTQPTWPSQPPRSARSEEPGWDLLEFPFAEVDWLAGHIASFGPDVVVVEPPDLRDAVIGCLKAVLT
ncbi:MAG TPA: WYL domain-containing protein [Streptosporangiaceae bacterium]|nr:WYL domain-containing protein [Streptosporangiaceae bacterium]